MIRHPLLLAFPLLLAGCQQTSEDVIESRIDELVAALNARDIAAGSKLFVGGEIPAIDPAGDSSVVYRLFAASGGEDFELVEANTTIIEDRAQSQLQLRGNVVRNDSVVGEMMLPLKLQLRRNQTGEWMILP